MALADIGRHIARLDQEHDLVVEEERDAGGASPGSLTWQPNRTDETCIITTQIVTERPWPTKEARA